MEPVLQTLISGLALGAIYVLFALGLSLVWGAFDVLNLAYGSIFMVGAFVAYEVAAAGVLPLLLVAGSAMIVTAVLAATVDLFVFGPIRRVNLVKEESQLAVLIASIGVATVPVAAVQYLTHGLPVYIRHEAFSIETFGLAGARVTNLQVLMLVLTLAIGISMAIVIRGTRPGRALRAVAFDAETAELFGVTPRFVSMVVMAVGGALAGLAGVLLAIYQSSITADMGDALLLKAFAVIVVGGVGSLAGSMVGGFALGMAETAIVAYGPSSYRDAIAFAVILAVLLIRPAGIFAGGQAERS